MSFNLSDKELLEQIKLGDKESFRLVYNKYFDDLYRYSQSMIKDKQLVEDLLQELFIGLWVKKEKIDILNLKAYLKTALRHKIINTYRSRKYVDLDDKIISLLPSANAEDTSFNERDFEVEFNNTMNKLPKKCRNVFYLSRIKRYKNREIAEKLDISIRTVEAHISNALQYFKIH